MNLAAGLWLAGLWFAAPLLRAARYRRADRVRDALVLGAAIPFALGFVHLLVPAALWIVLGACAIGGVVRERSYASASDASSEPVPYLLVAALALVAWPGLMRPLLDGDSLAYHLPNAATWAHAHSLWATTTLYWWYPPASELFASALFAVAGPFAIQCAGAFALILLALRVETYAREELGCSALLAQSCAAALVTIPALAFQAGTLDNDVWLAAFALETLVTPSAGAAAVTALLKPFGWIFAALALVLKRAPFAQWMPAVAAFALWAAHDAIANPSAAIAIGATSIPHLWSTGIVEHGWTGITTLVAVLSRSSPAAFVAFAIALAAPFFPRAPRALALLACASAIWFLVMPFAYANGVPQLADGTSLRFAAPAFALGMLLLTHTFRPYERLVIPAYVLSAAFGAWTVLATFWNDAPTRSALAVAIVALALCALAARRRDALVVPISAIAAIAVAAWLAGRAPAPYYADAYAIGGERSGLFAWIAETRPPSVTTWGLRSGTIAVLSPRTRAYDTPAGIDACAAARHNGSLLVTMRERDNPSLDPARRAATLACGRVLYQDRLAVVAQPSAYGRIP